jgi:hypothetical protein
MNIFAQLVPGLTPATIMVLRNSFISVSPLPLNATATISGTTISVVFNGTTYTGTCPNSGTLAGSPEWISCVA